MDYFVSIENNDYCHWQVELLIQSFKKLNKQDELVIGIAKNDDPQLNYFYTNIVNHKRKFQHNNVKQNNCHNLNRSFAIAAALEQGFIKQPFALIHADMVMINPIAESFVNNAIYFDYRDVDQIVIEKIKPFVDDLLHARGIKFMQIPLGAVMVFNNVPSLFFHRVYQQTLRLIEKTGSDWDVEKGAWLLTMYEYAGLFELIGNFFSVDMTKGINGRNFIHYKRGNPPHFHKVHFRYDLNALMSIENDNPYDAIASQPPVNGIRYLQEVLGDYQKGDYQKNKEKKYSQLGQDDWALATAKHKFFVEFGSSDGLLLSNTKLLEDQGWNGICAEAIPEFFNDLSKNRKCTAVNMCLWSKSGESIEFLINDNDPVLSGVEGFFDTMHHREGTKIMVTTITLKDLLDTYHAPKEIGYLSLDTEGTELEILKAFDWSYKFDCLSVEHNCMTDNKIAIRSLLESKGYVLCRETECEDWFTHTKLSKQNKRRKSKAK